MKTDHFQSCGHCWVFQICWHIECSTFTASSFRIWNSSTGIPSPPLALLVAMLPKAQLTSCSRMSGSRWVETFTGLGCFTVLQGDIFLVFMSWIEQAWRLFVFLFLYVSCLCPLLIFFPMNFSLSFCTSFCKEVTIEAPVSSALRNIFWGRDPVGVHWEVRVPGRRLHVGLGGRLRPGSSPPPQCCGGGVTPSSSTSPRLGRGMPAQ